MIDGSIDKRVTRRHNAEVIEYFRHRPQDLLVMDMSQGAGWYPLCGFLRTSIPATPYPHEFATQRDGSPTFLGEGI